MMPTLELQSQQRQRDKTADDNILRVGPGMDEGESMTVNICPARLIQRRDLWFCSEQFELKAIPFMELLLYFRKQVSEDCT